MGESRAKSSRRSGDRPLASVARDQIYAMIVRLQLRPGERILESQLQRRTGLGRTPIREALFQLSREGLVVRDARGFAVAELSSREVGELYEVREELEVLSVRRAILQATDDQLRELETVIAEVSAGTRGAEDRWVLGWRFHRSLARLSGNQVLEELLEQLLRRIERVRFMEILSDPSGDRAREEHRRIFEAVARRDVEAAEGAVRAHIRASRERVLSLFDLKYQLALA
ncbi:MAG: GntR family transcriptional regulator [Armatimonadota bacterium]|nr:GntR family transcriptional regulator [Armatimonadota bacterium]